MTEYPKIQTLFRRDTDNNMKTLLWCEYACDEFEYLRNSEWIYTEKIDGTNIRVEIGNCKNLWGTSFHGRSDKSVIPDNLKTVLVELFNKPDSVNKYGDLFQDNCNVCLYGEGYGGGVQGNKYGDAARFVLFDVQVDGLWLTRDKVCEVGYRLDIDVVPNIGEGCIGEMVDMVKAGFKSRWGDFHAEGIVARPYIDIYDKNGNRIITKLKCKDFA